MSLQPLLIPEIKMESQVLFSWRSASGILKTRKRVSGIRLFMNLNKEVAAEVNMHIWAVSEARKLSILAETFINFNQ